MRKKIKIPFMIKKKDYKEEEVDKNPRMKS